jgi:DNA-binding MarR family transcriptional regulator
MESYILQHLRKTYSELEATFEPGGLATGLLIRASRGVATSLDALLRPIGSSLAQLELLAALYYEPSGAMSLGELAREVFVHPATITSSVRRLERDGLVRRVQDPSDRRTTLLILTSEGRRRCELGKERLREAGWGVEGISAEHLRQLVHLLDEILCVVVPDAVVDGDLQDQTGIF